jgi:hypothetical protein
MSAWRNFRQNDPRVARSTYSTQHSNPAIQTRIPTKSFLVLSSPFLVNSQPGSEVKWTTWRECEVREFCEFSFMREQNECMKCATEKAPPLARAHAHYYYCRSVDAILKRSTGLFAAHKRRNRIGRRCALVFAVSFAACVKRARGNFSASTNGSLPHSDLWYDQFFGLHGPAPKVEPLGVRGCCLLGVKKLVRIFFCS